MRKRSSSYSPNQHGIVCSNDDLCQILSGVNLRQSSFVSVGDQGHRRKTLGETLSVESNRESVVSHPTANNFLEVKSRKLRTRSLQPDVLLWDTEKHLSVQPELLGSVIESYIMNKRASLESSELPSQTKQTPVGPRSSLPGRLSVSKNSFSYLNSSSGLKTSSSSSKEKRFVVVDELDLIRRSSSINANFAQRVSSRKEDSFETALKKMNI